MKNFEIHKDQGVISNEFLNRNITDFHSASKYVSELPYKRNSDKNNILCVFDDLGGTCSTKHAVLRKLALENNQQDVKLILGIFKMDAEYTQKIKSILKKINLNYIPEAHNYLKIDDEYFDFTKPNSKYADFKSKLLIEKEIECNEIANDKISFHKNFLEKWIADEDIPYNLEGIWNIREQCIKDLQENDEVENQNFSSVCFVNSLEVRDDYKL
jgi:predicted transcriptional regulator with HTH domain